MKWRTLPLKKPELLRPGAIVRHRTTGLTYQVLREGKDPVVIRHLTLTHPPEWERVIIEEDP